MSALYLTVATDTLKRPKTARAHYSIDVTIKRGVDPATRLALLIQADRDGVVLRCGRATNSASFYPIAHIPWDALERLLSGAEPTLITQIEVGPSEQDR